MKDVLRLLSAAVKVLPQGLQDHLQRVRETALDLAAKHGIDPLKVEVATLGHDLYRAHPEAQLLSEARAVGLAIDPVEERVPVLLHGPLAALRLQREMGLADQDVLEAVRWHSTCRAGMGKVGLVLYIADKAEPDKAKGSALRRRVAKTAQVSLERAALLYLTSEIAALLKAGSLVHPASVEARNDMLVRLQQKG